MLTTVSLALALKTVVHKPLSSLTNSPRKYEGRWRSQLLLLQYWHNYTAFILIWRLVNMLYWRKQIGDHHSNLLANKIQQAIGGSSSGLGTNTFSSTLNNKVLSNIGRMTLPFSHSWFPLLCEVDPFPILLCICIHYSQDSTTNHLGTIPLSIYRYSLQCNWDVGEQKNKDWSSLFYHLNYRSRKTTQTSTFIFSAYIHNTTWFCSFISRIDTTFHNFCKTIQGGLLV